MLSNSTLPVTVPPLPKPEYVLTTGEKVVASETLTVLAPTATVAIAMLPWRHNRRVRSVFAFAPEMASDPSTVSVPSSRSISRIVPTPISISAAKYVPHGAVLLELDSDDEAEETDDNELADIDEDDAERDELDDAELADDASPLSQYITSRILSPDAVLRTVA